MSVEEGKGLATEPVTPAIEEPTVPVVEEPVVPAEPVAEGSTEDPSQPTTPVPQEPLKAYTPEEVKAILAEEGFDAVDTSRLSEEGQLIMRSMQAGLTPKLQEASELRKENETIKQQFEELQKSVDELRPKKAPETLEEYYDQDPEGTMTYLNGQIRELMQNPVENALQLEQLREVRDNLRLYDLKKVHQIKEQESQVAQVYSALAQEVPGIETKQHDLAKFAREQLGWSDNEINDFTNIGTRGMDAVRQISLINKAYDKWNAQNTVKGKRTTQAPATVEPPGSGQHSHTDADSFQAKKQAAMKGEISWEEALKYMGS